MTSQASDRARIDFLLRVCSDRAAHIERLKRENADSRNTLADRDEQNRRLEAALVDRDKQIRQLESTIAAHCRQRVAYQQRPSRVRLQVPEELAWSSDDAALVGALLLHRAIGTPEFQPNLIFFSLCSSETASSNKKKKRIKLALDIHIV